MKLLPLLSQEFPSGESLMRWKNHPWSLASFRRDSCLSFACVLKIVVVCFRLWAVTSTPGRIILILLDSTHLKHSGDSRTSMRLTRGFGQELLDVLVRWVLCPCLFCYHISELFPGTFLASLVRTCHGLEKLSDSPKICAVLKKSEF